MLDAIGSLNALSSIFFRELVFFMDMSLDYIEQSICYKFKDSTLFRYAMIHSSIQTNNNHFERLEFLGDKVLGLIIAQNLLSRYKDSNEGKLSSMHSDLVSYMTCAKVAIDIGINNIIKTASLSLKSNLSVLADAMEALIAAVFLDASYVVCHDVVTNLWDKYIDVASYKLVNSKSRLQELTQSRDGSLPVYTTLSVTGLDHQQTFEVSVYAMNQTVNGIGKSKKEAEMDAAEKMLKRFD